MVKSVFFYRDLNGYAVKVSLKDVMHLAFLKTANRQKVKEALYTPGVNEYFFGDGSHVFRREV